MLKLHPCPVLPAPLGYIWRRGQDGVTETTTRNGRKSEDRKVVSQTPKTKSEKTKKEKTAAPGTSGTHEAGKEGSNQCKDSPEPGPTSGSSPKGPRALPVAGNWSALTGSGAGKQPVIDESTARLPTAMFAVCLQTV